MYLLMKKFGATQQASLISAIIFSFNGYIITRIEFLSVLATYVWLPFIITAIDFAIEKNKPRYISLTALFMALQILSGSPQSTFYSFIAVFIFVLYKIISFKHVSIDRRFSPLLILFISVLFALALSMVQVLTFIEFIKVSIRSSGLDYITASRWSLHPSYLLNFFTPSFFGSIINSTYSGSDQFWTSSFYTGIFAIVFAIFTIFYLKRNKNAILYYVLFAISIILALGDNTPLYRFIYGFIPGFKMIRYPSVIIYIGVFSVAVLAGFGFDCIERKKPSIKVIYVSLIAVILVLCLLVISVDYKEQTIKFLKHYFFNNISFNYLLFIIKRFNVVTDSLCFSLTLLTVCLLLILMFIKKYISRSTFGWFVTTAVIVDLFLYGIEINPSADTHILKHKTRIIKFLEKEKEPFRITLSPYTSKLFNSKYYFENNMDYDVNVSGIDYINSAKSMLSHNINILFKIQSVSGYDPVRVRYYEELLDLLFSQKSPSETRLLDIMNIKYILSLEKIQDKNLILLMKDCNINLYENKRCLPRVFIVEKETDDFKKPVLLPYQTKINFYATDRITIGVKPEKDCLLILSDTYYPGWNVKVDGKKRDIIKVYKAFRGVKLKKGEKTVEFYYSPLSFRVGAIITITAFIFMLFMV